ncbi:hypothetical protein GOP47_0016968 [Adiantum capillus-veneris]|uniref:Enkurin domain-containing protein n=1 Tax=Adiantum capillus-veneris TaxID=13818 RepID=A0A9D4UIN9_ADICA|nr:hypothetical protein GOP47_0016968 [Adiantum capillus-veneris]
MGSLTKPHRQLSNLPASLSPTWNQAALCMEPPPQVKTYKPKPESQPTWKASENAVDFVMKNRKDVARVPTRRPKNPEPCCQNFKENFGKIPSYLIKRKIELAQEMEKRLNNEKSHQLPPGYVEMDEDEKNEVLQALKENKASLEKKLGGLPLVCDTPSQIRARSNMDLELQGIENAIKRFSRPHVYISLND